MRRVAVLLFAVLGAVLLPSSSLAQEEPGPTTAVVLVHGLNTDGRTFLTLCEGTSQVTEGWEFGSMTVFGAKPTGEPISLQVYEWDLGEGDVDCANPPAPPIIDQTVIPTGDAMSVIITSNDPEGVPELLSVLIDNPCVEPGTSRSVVVHAANAPEVEVFNADFGTTETISYGEHISSVLPVGSYPIQVSLDGTPIAQFDLPVIGDYYGQGEPGARYLVWNPGFVVAHIVGNQPGNPPTPVAVFLSEGNTPSCQEPAPPAPPAAAPAGGEPSFAG